MNFIMIYSIIVLFIIPNETYLKINNFLLIFFILNLILSIYKTINLSKLELITTVSFITIPFLLVYYKELLRILDFSKELIYLYPFFLFRRYEEEELNFKGIQLIYYLALISLIIQVCRYRYLDRMVLSVIDPNVSGGIILLFYYLSIKLNNKIGVIFSFLCCILFKSRNLILALMVFFLVRCFKKYFKKLIELVDIRIIFLIIYILFIFINILYLKKYNFNSIEIGYSENISRLTNVVDHSNTYRFMFNTEILNNLLKNMKLFLIGGEKLYIPSVDKNIFIEISPHNDFFKSVYFYGFIFTSIKFIYILGTIKKKIKIYENYEFIISYIVFGSFLGAIILIPNVYIFYFCLLLDEKLKNGWEIDEVNSNNTSIQC